MARRMLVGTIAVLALGVAFMAIGPAGAEGSTRSSISLSYSTSRQAFRGQVASRRSNCMVDRNVTVYRTAGHSAKNEGHGGKGGDQGDAVAVGSTNTGRRGFYSIAYPQRPGVYFASVQKVSLTGYRHTVCDGATSRKVPVTCAHGGHGSGDNDRSKRGTCDRRG